MEVTVFKACCFCWPYDFPNPTVIPISYLAQKREVCDAIYLLNARGGGGKSGYLSIKEREEVFELYYCICVSISLFCRPLLSVFSLSS